MKSVIAFVHQNFEVLIVPTSPEKIADVVTKICGDEIKRIIRDTESGGTFDGKHHTEFIKMVFGQ